MAVITTDQLQCVNFSAGGDMDSESGVTTCMKQNGNICRVGGGVFNGAGAADNSDAGYWASSISSGTFVQNAVWQPQGGIISGIISDKKDAAPAKKSWTLGNTNNKHHAGGGGISGVNAEFVSDIMGIMLGKLASYSAEECWNAEQDAAYDMYTQYIDCGVGRSGGRLHDFTTRISTFIMASVTAIFLDASK